MAGDWQPSCCTPGPSTALDILIEPDSQYSILPPLKGLTGNKFEKEKKKKTDLKRLSSNPLACGDGDLMADNNLLSAY